MGNYIFVCDTDLYLKLRMGIVLSAKANLELHALEQEYLAELIRLIDLRGGSATIFRWEHFVDGIKGLMRGNTLPIISLDDVLGHDLGDLLHINSVVDISQQPYGRTTQPRIGYSGLEEQAKQLAAKYGNVEVSLFDDDVVTGNTILQSADLLRKYGITVNKVFTGGATAAGLDKLNSKGIEVIALSKEPILEFDEVRNFLCDGRVIDKSKLDLTFSAAADRIYSPIWDMLRERSYFSGSQLAIRKLSEEYIAKLQNLFRENDVGIEIVSLGEHYTYSLYCVRRQQAIP